MNKALLGLSLLGLMACGTVTDPPADTADAGAGVDALAVEADAVLTADGTSSGAINGCAPDALGLCAYVPAATYELAQPQTLELSYEDAAGLERTFEIAVRAPIGAPEPLPVIVWSHGGADGVGNALNAGEHWTKALARAGYLVIPIAHRGRSANERAALCNELGYDTTGCQTFKYLNWDRPHDARRVFDFIEAQAATGPFAGRIDATRILYAGHSAGSGATLMVNGAPRDFNGTMWTLSDPRPIAFISNSPQGPGDEGFVESSFATITRPTLINTGAGDDTGNALGENRTLVYDLVQPNDKYRLYITEEAGRHGTFNLESDACQSYSQNHELDVARCTDYEAWLLSATLAFADRYARQSAAASAYLASDNLNIGAQTGATWERR